MKTIEKKKKILTMQRRRGLEAFIFLLPGLIGICAFFIGPIISSAKLSFSEIVKLRGFEMGWVGLENYEYIFTYDINFMPIFVNVVIETLINIPMTIVFSMIIAILINRPAWGRGFFRSCFFIPVLLGSGYVMDQLLSIDATGAVGVGITVPMLLQSVLGTTITAIIQSFLDRTTVVLWKSGVQILLFLAGLQGISSSLYEAAKCDGATQWEMFWKITLPMISPIILLNFIYTLVMYFTSADNELVDYIIQKVFTDTQFGQGAAMGWAYFGFIFLLCGLVFLILRVSSKSERE